MSTFLGRAFWVVLWGFLILNSAPNANAHGYKNGTIEVRHPWMMPTKGGSAVVSMKLKNVSGQTERLISASVQTGETANLVDRSSVDVKLTAADAVKSAVAIAIPAGETVELSDASVHIRIDGLKAPLAAYDRFTMTLVFERSGPLTIEVVIEESPSP